MSKGFVGSLLIALMIVALIPALLAQSSGTGALVGTVTDPSNAVVPNVTVTLTSNDTQQARTATTTADGTYRFGFLPPGTYKIRFSAGGFKPAEVPSVTVNVTETPVFNQKLEVGAQTDQVTVEANAETIQTASSALGTVVAGSTATALPLSTRNYTNLLSMSAGANANVNNATALGRGGTEIAVNGAMQSQNSYLMDGVNVTAFGNGGGLTQGGYAAFALPNPDTISEFKIQTSNYDAGYGRNPGANVNVVTKSGTNAFHGTAFEFFRNAQLNANDFFYNRDVCPTETGTCAKQVLNQNQYGGVIGGPIKKDKLFFFTSYQQSWQKNGEANSAFSSTILPGLPAGDRGTRVGGPAGTLDATGQAYLQALGAAFCNQATAAGGMQVACNGSNINPIAMNFLQAKTTTGQYFIPSGSGRVAYSDPALDQEYQGMLNLDYLVNAKNTIAFRGYAAANPQNEPLVGTFFPELPGSPLSAQYQYKNAIAKVTTIISNNIVNEARGALLFTGFAGFNNPPPSTYASNIFPGIAPGQNFLGGGLPFSPALSFLSGPFIAGGETYTDNVVNNVQPSFGDTVSWSKGKHTIRIGGDFERSRWDWDFRGLSHGNLWFFDMQDFLIGLPGNCGPAQPGVCNGGSSGSIFSSQVFSTASSPSGIVHAYRANDADMYIQDDFKVSSRLTLNMGLRWEYDGMVSDKYGNASNMSIAQLNKVPVPGSSPATGSYAGWVVPNNYNPAVWGALPTGVVESNHNIPTADGVPLLDFAPRLGFAWQPLKNTNRFVIRGGAGFFYDRVNGDDMIHAVEEAPPYSHDINETGIANAFASLASPYMPIPKGFPIRWVNFANDTSSNLSVIAIADRFVTPVTYTWNMNFQYEFLPRWVLEVGYIGSHGINQGQNLHNVNGALLATPQNPVNGLTVSTSTNASLRVPLLGFSPEGFQLADTVGAYKFNSLQATLRKQLSHGVTFQAAYTFSRAFSDMTSGGNAGGQSNSGDPNNLRQQYILSPQYRPQRLVINYSWDIPYGSLKGVARAALGGWNISGVTTIQDGQPMSLYDTNGGGVYGLNGNNISRVQMAAGCTYGQLATSGGLVSRLNNYIDQSCITNIPYVGTDPNATLWGNSGGGILFGPGQFNFDATIGKTTRVGGVHENAALQFRAEFFNLFNHPQFSNPDQNRTDGGFGQISTTSVNARVVQLALKYIF
jgi:hypothetical protein